MAFAFAAASAFTEALPLAAAPLLDFSAPLDGTFAVVAPLGELL
jgi:hypothetical protein